MVRGLREASAEEGIGGHGGVVMKKEFPRTCVSPSGMFLYGVHQPHFTVFNLRKNDHIVSLGQVGESESVVNAANFPQDDVHVPEAMWVYEIPNAFPFMGATFIPKTGAESHIDACNPFKKKPPRSSDIALKDLHGQWRDPGQAHGALLGLAKTSVDPAFLSELAEKACVFIHDKKTGNPTGLRYEKTPDGQLRPVISDWHLFELVSNNRFLPDAYKQAMVLTPGVQGDSPIVGEYMREGTHIWEYLRENSYIPWGHYAANMAQDAIRYTIGSLSLQDVVGLRHLYYQRVYLQLAGALGMPVPVKRRSLEGDALENLRVALVGKLKTLHNGNESLPFNATVWGQNFGFDLSPSGYRLNASHQQVHQQYALVQPSVPGFIEGRESPGSFHVNTFTQGDLVAEFVLLYEQMTGRPFFETYLHALTRNERMDGRTDRNRALIYYENDHVVGFVPKAQRSQGEVQLMTKAKVGNIIEADNDVRYALDCGILVTMKILENLGADMVTVFELSKRFDTVGMDQRLIYCFLPKHPQSPGSFTECQQRWIIGHYPEDYAEACRTRAERMGPECRVC